MGLVVGSGNPVATLAHVSIPPRAGLAFSFEGEAR